MCVCLSLSLSLSLSLLQSISPPKTLKPKLSPSIYSKQNPVVRRQVGKRPTGDAIDVGQALLSYQTSGCLIWGLGLDGPYLRVGCTGLSFAGFLFRVFRALSFRLRVWLRDS